MDVEEASRHPVKHTKFGIGYSQYNTVGPKMFFMVDPDERRYQIFVSSTFTDLREERQHVLQAILENQAFPSGMELFPSADDEQWEFIKREIESSDYYVVIVAGKYGSLAPDGTSFTEKEYDYAVEIRKPVMGFLFHDLGELKGHLLETDQTKREKLEAFRAKVSRGKLIKQYRSPEQLKNQVYQALSHAFRFKPQTGWVRAKTARREDLEEIAGLQKEVMRLTAENAELNTSQDRRAKLAHASDSVTWDLTLGWGGGYPLLEGVKPIAEEHPKLGPLAFQTTCNELLATSFKRKIYYVAINDVEDRLSRLITRRAIEAGIEPRWTRFQRIDVVDDGSWERNVSIYDTFSSEQVVVSDREVRLCSYPRVKAVDLESILNGAIEIPRVGLHRGSGAHGH